MAQADHDLAVGTVDRGQLSLGALWYRAFISWWGSSSSIAGVYNW